MKNISSSTSKSIEIPFFGKDKKGWLIFLPLFFIGYCQAIAQINIIPLSGPNTQKAQARVAVPTALTLPFFDDFSGNNQGLEPTKWLPSGGVLVNNSYSNNHPTLNIVTFDGLKADGRPYVFTNSFAEGPVDTLTSQPINLAVYAPADSVYMSFFWQNRSLGDLPNTNDSLRLQFLTNGGIWQTVWTVKGDVEATNYQQVLLPIRARLYLHEQFQFRFQAFGRQSGQFDIWNIDYVYINKGRSANDKYYRDLAVRKSVSPLLKRYRSMPLKQLLGTSTQDLADSLSTDVTYLFNNENFFDYTAILQNELTGTILYQNEQRNIRISGITDTTIPSVALQLKLNNIKDKLQGDSIVLKASFRLSTTDDNTLQRKMNDTISTRTVLSNYYAYDDGSAEAGAYLGKGFGRIAAQFINNKPDAVAGVRLNLLPMLTNLEGNPITIQIMDNNKGKPGNVIRSLYTKVSYANVINGFVEYAIEPVAVKDTFYIGILQFTDSEPIILGLDNNSPQYSGKYFYNLSSEWINLSTVANNQTFAAAKGSLMMRPVMGGIVKDVVLGTEYEEQNKYLAVYPNPSNGVIFWNDNSLKNVEIVDLQGKSVWKEKVNTSQLTVDTLNSGTYILLLSNERNTFVRKINIIR